MTTPFIPLSSDNTRVLLRTIHERDPECLPGLLLRLFFGLTATQSAAARREHFSPHEHRLELPTRDAAVAIRRPGLAWLEFYRPDKARLDDPICSMPARVWAARFRRLAPGYQVGALRRSFLYYQRIARGPIRTDERIPLAQEPRIELLRISLLHPANFLPPLDPPVFRKVIEQPVPTPPPMAVSQLNLA